MTFFPTNNPFMAAKRVNERKTIMTFHSDVRRHRSSRGREHGWEFRLMFAATFLVMLVPTLFSRLTLSDPGEDGSRGSIFHEASARADKIVPFMFMG